MAEQQTIPNPAHTPQAAKDPGEVAENLYRKMEFNEEGEANFKMPTRAFRFAAACEMALPRKGVMRASALVNKGNAGQGDGEPRSNDLKPPAGNSSAPGEARSDLLDPPPGNESAKGEARSDDLKPPAGNFTAPLADNAGSPPGALSTSDGVPEDDDSGPMPITIHARSSKPIEHPDWGRIVHDMSGMMANDRVALDYGHHGNKSANNIIGFAEPSKADKSDGLRIPSTLTPDPRDPADQAAKVAHLMRSGVPMSASINFGGQGMRYEFVDRGQCTMCNNEEMAGPLWVARQWPLCSLAICATGADDSAEVNFSDPVPTQITLFKAPQGQKATATMASATQNPAAPATPAPTAPVTPAPEISGTAASTAFTAQDYMDALGDEQGALMFVKKVPLNVAIKSVREKLEAQASTRLAATEAALGVALKRLDKAAGLVGNDPAAASSPEGSPQHGGVDDAAGGSGTALAAIGPDGEVPKTGDTYSDGTKFGTPGHGMRLFLKGMGQKVAAAKKNGIRLSPPAN